MLNLLACSRPMSDAFVHGEFQSPSMHLQERTTITFDGNSFLYSENAGMFISRGTFSVNVRDRTIELISKELNPSNKLADSVFLGLTGEKIKIINKDKLFFRNLYLTRTGKYISLSRVP